MDSTPLDTAPALHDWSVSTLPFPLAQATLDYLHEERVYSADELSSLIEAWLKHLGWLWIAEYLHSDNNHELLNRMLYQLLLLGRRSPSVGTWAYIGSNFSHCYEREGWTCKVPGLRQLSYGDPDDHHSPLSRLLHFRNHFAHGSFEAIVSDILQHQEYLQTWLEPLQGFAKAPILFRDSPDQCWRYACENWLPFENEEQLPSTDSEVIVWLPKTREILPLSPVVTLSPTNDKAEWDWKYFYVPKASQEEKKALLFTNSHVQAALEELEEQRSGRLDFEIIRKEGRLPSLNDEELEEYKERIRAGLLHPRPRPNLVLILGYPRSGKTGFLARAHEWFPEYKHILLYQIQRSEISASASTFLRTVLRQLSSRFQRPEWTEAALSNEPPLSMVQTAFQELEREGETVLIGIDNIHLGYEPAWGDSESLADVIASLDRISNKHLSFLLTARPGYQEGLFRDTLIKLPPAPDDGVLCYRRYLRELHLDEELAEQVFTRQELLLRRTLLFLLGCSPSPLTAFELCIALERLLEQDDSLPLEYPVFTPHIERALWELRPLLQTHQVALDENNTTKTYAPYNRNFARWLLQNPPF